jgi:hypothetical protein
MAWFSFRGLRTQQLMHAALGVDVELASHGLEMGSVRESGAPQSAIRRRPQHADLAGEDVAALEQLLVLRGCQGGEQLRALRGREPGPVPLDPLGSPHVLSIHSEFRM